jgi:phasin family protein
MTIPRKPAASSRRPTARSAQKAATPVAPVAGVVPTETEAVSPSPVLEVPVLEVPAPVVVPSSVIPPTVAEPIVVAPVVIKAVEPESEPVVPAASVSKTTSPFFQGLTKMTTTEHTFAAAKEQFEKFSKSFLGGFGDFASVGRENLEAFVKASTIFAKGTEEIGKSVAALTQSQVEASLATTKALMGVTNFKQAIELQNEAAKTSFDKLVFEGNKITELSMKVANEAIEPIQARVTVAVEKIMKPAA